MTHQGATHGSERVEAADGRLRQRAGAGDATLTVEVEGALGTIWLEVDAEDRLIKVEVREGGSRGRPSSRARQSATASCCD
jgi:hypothetical protein